MTRFSRQAESMIGSEIVKLGNAINARKAQGENIFNFTIGDFDPAIFPIPAELEKLIVEKYRSHCTNYPPGDGVLRLRKAISHFLSKREGLQYNTDEIMIASGGRPIIYTVFRTLVDPGDKVIYAAPSWNNNHYCNMTQAEHCVINTTAENNFMPTVADIEPYIKGAALICLCTPQNPTGTTLPRAELQRICEMVLAENARRAEGDKKLYVLFDQMYWTLTYGDTEHTTPVNLMPEMKAYTLFVDGISKAFASTGVRVGWSMGPHEVIAKMKNLLTHIGAWAPMAEQQAVADYLMMDDAVDQWFAGFKQAVYDRLEQLAEGFRSLASKGYPVEVIAPQAAIYLTVKIDLKGKSWNGKLLERQEDVTDFLLSEAKLAVVPFSAFGASKESPWYRISVGTCALADIPVMMAQLEAALASLSLA